MLDAEPESNPTGLDGDVDVTSADFAARFGSLLKGARRARRLRLRHLATPEFPVSTLRAVERGTHSLTPLVASELAAQYGAELAELFPARQALVLLATGTVSAGGIDEHFDAGDIDSVLEAYLRLIGRLRGDSDVTTLRRDDLSDIADQLGRPRPEIIDRVGELAGATPAQRRAMVQLYLAGADVVGLCSL